MPLDSCPPTDLSTAVQLLLFHDISSVGALSAQAHAACCRHREAMLPRSCAQDVHVGALEGRMPSWRSSLCMRRLCHLARLHRAPSGTICVARSPNSRRILFTRCAQFRPLARQLCHTFEASHFPPQSDSIQRTAWMRGATKPPKCMPGCENQEHDVLFECFGMRVILLESLEKQYVMS